MPAYGEDVIRALANSAAATTYGDLPAEAVDAVKMALIDTLGAMIAGTTAPGCGALVDLAHEWGGNAGSTVIVYGDRVPAPSAAMANSAMARAREAGEAMRDHLQNVTEAYLKASVSFPLPL